MNQKINWKNPVAIFFILLYIYIIVNMITIREEEGGGLFNQAIAGLILVFNTLNIIFAKKSIPSFGKRVYYILLAFFVYITIRTLVFLLVDFRTAIFTVRNAITLLFWASSFLFCIQEFKRVEIKKLSRLAIVLIVIALINFLVSLIVKRTYFLSEGRNLSAVNAVSSVYMLIPLILLVLKGRIKFLAYIMCVILSALSQKRQSLLGVGVVSFFVLFDLLSSFFKTFKFRGIIYLIVALFFSSIIFNTVFSGIIERQKYLTERDEYADSGRRELRQTAIMMYGQAPLTRQIFGGGPGTGGRYIEKHYGFFNNPHCGFVEVLCDYGIFGLLIYVSFFFSLFRFAFHFQSASLYRKLLLGICISWVISNIISHAGAIWTIFFCVAIGFMINEDSHLRLQYIIRKF